MSLQPQMVTVTRLTSHRLHTGSVAAVIMPGMAPGREQGPQEPHQFPPTEAAGTHFHCNPEDTSISAGKNGKAGF